MAASEPGHHQSLSSPASDDDRPSQIEQYSEKAPSQQEGTSAPDFGPPPDGGLQAWLVVTGGFFAVFASFGWINCIGIFQDYYEQNQLKSYSSSDVAWISSIESFMLFFWGPVVGYMTDNYGPRIPILIGSFLHVFGLMMTSLSKKYYQIILSQSICSALGCSFLFYAPIAAAGTWFKRHRAIAFGIITAGSSLGGVVLPIMVNKLVVRVGFGWAMRSVAFLFLGLLVIANVTIKSRLPPPRRKFDIKDFITPFKEMPFLLLTVAGFMLYLGSFLPFNFIIVQAKELGVSDSLAQYLVSIVNAASTFGRLVPAYFGDRIGVFNVMIPLTLLGGIFTLTVWLTAHSTASVVAYAALYGFASGCTLSIVPAMVASFSDVRSIGTRNGALYGVAAIGVLIGSPVAGAIVSAEDGNFSGLIIFCGVTILAGAVFAIMSRQALTGGQWLKKV
ncbi:monocarboxylate transporter 2 [Fusarium acutatum]|uniref:Monocarboxylate transporter 2 n=1 Tax=Fusarium acutatum TaxID=78861 RepID=A0A8H4JHZ6_9HYPO|nr:monocarboxylate transporter 2 [Fusarium acutatum]